MRLSLLLALVVSLIGAIGCSNEKSDHGRVTGNVTLDGAPVTGSIMFTPAGGASPAGGNIEAGKYEVEVPLGASKVAISSPKVVGQRKLYNTPESPTQPIMDESLPAKYNAKTELTIDVQPGANEQDFPLTTK